MRRWSARGQAEPLAALAAVFAVGVGLAVYAGALPEADEPSTVDPDTVLQDVRQSPMEGGVLVPGTLGTGREVPAGWEVNVTLETPDGRRTLGPSPPPDARRASRPVTVRLAPGALRPGRLRVAVWR